LQLTPDSPVAQFMHGATTVHELVVLAWEKSFWPMLSEILSLLIESIVTKSNTNSTRLSELFQAASSPDAVPDLGSAMEVIVASRRDEVIAEVVQRDINELLEDYRSRSFH